MSVTGLQGVLDLRGTLQRQLARQRQQPWLIQPDDRCPRCRLLLYMANPHAEAQYDTFLLHRCPWCGHDLHLPGSP